MSEYAHKLIEAEISRLEGNATFHEANAAESAEDAKKNLVTAANQRAKVVELRQLLSAPPFADIRPPTKGDTAEFVEPHLG